MKTFAHQTLEQVSGVASPNKRRSWPTFICFRGGANVGSGESASIRRRDARGGRGVVCKLILHHNI